MRAERPLPAGWRRVTSHDGTRIAWRLDGPPAALTGDGRVPRGQVAVVLCNGISCDHVYWERVWPALAERAPVLRWHYRGHGYSDDPHSPSEVTVSSVVRDLYEVCLAAGVERAVLVGHSYGVQVICEAVRDRPELAVALCAVAGAYGSPLGRPFGRNPGVWVFDLLRLLLTRTPTGRLFLWSTRLPTADPLARAVRLVGPRAPRELMRRWFDHLNRVDLDVLLRMMRAMQDHTTDDLLPTITVPVVAIAGGRDWATPPRVAQRMVERVADGRLVVVDDASHTLPIEAPEVVIREVLGLLDRVAGRATGRAGRR